MVPKNISVNDTNPKKPNNPNHTFPQAHKSCLKDEACLNMFSILATFDTSRFTIPPPTKLGVAWNMLSMVVTRPVLKLSAKSTPPLL